MKYIADFHIHSRFSRATAKTLDLEHLYQAAQIKGITVLGSSDFTHPAWAMELKQKLQPAEEGLFKLQTEIADHCDAQIPPSCRRQVRFILVTEISNIYKKNGRTRKNHNLVFLPDLQALDRFNRRLEKIGNIVSDGRPILGLDARNLLEIVLETSSSGFLVPAHIWTPWFSVLGSKSGFDSIEECFEDLADHIFALETGLSSDPSMNWRVSALDRFTLISNSDAHSPAKLGREANIFNTELSFNAVRRALQGSDDSDGNDFLGTIEFYPEEGKYHVDGHRKCGFFCLPARTHQLKELCPVCGKALTLGVLYRVESLADRAEGIRPPKAKPFIHLIPLVELLADIFQCGDTSQKVIRAYDLLISRLGSEFDILSTIPIEEINRGGIPLLSEAINRMRGGRVEFEPGFDGQFGMARIFNPTERERLMGQQGLFCDPEQSRLRYNLPQMNSTHSVAPELPVLVHTENKALVLNSEQLAAVRYGSGPLLIVAGPGTGKTRTITSRIGELITVRAVAPQNILAVTFTHKAAEEMRSRIEKSLPEASLTPFICTFHGLCLQLLKDSLGPEEVIVLDDNGRWELLQDAVAKVRGETGAVSLSARKLLEYIMRAKQYLLRPTDDLRELVPQTDLEQMVRVYTAYQSILAFQKLFDFEDIIASTTLRLRTDDALRERLQQRFTYIFVDEFQDINYSQYALIRTLARSTANVCVIGDPDQSIYGFRGSDRSYFQKFGDDYPTLRTIRLQRNYRSSETILTAAYQVIEKQHRSEPQNLTGRVYSGITGHPEVLFVRTASPRAEAVAIGKTIEAMVGGIGLHSIDFGKMKTNYERERSFGDFAVLYRTTVQGEILAQTLIQAGIPCQMTDSRALRQDPVYLQLMALLRMITGQAGYADLNHLADLTRPALSKQILQMFKAWAYDQQIPLVSGLRTALRLPLRTLSLSCQQRLVTLIRLVQDMARACVGKSVAETISFVVERTLLSERLRADQLADILFRAAAFGTDVSAFLGGQATQSDTDLFRPDVEKVALLTMHAAKGLEFPIVFIAGCEAGLIPLQRTSTSPADLEEERRLMFVAMTRARDQLILTMARKRTLHGKILFQSVSPFVAEIDTLLQYQSGGEPVQHVHKQLSLF